MRKSKNLNGSRTISPADKGLKKRAGKIISGSSLRKIAGKSSVRNSAIKLAGKKNTDKDELTKNFLEKATQKSLEEAADETMKVMGYNVIAQDGWVVKVFPNKAVERISRIPQVTESK